MNLSIGPLAFQLAHVLALACALMAVGVGRLVGWKRRIGISAVMFDMALVSALVGRTVFVALWFSTYQEDPWSVFDIRDGGFEPWAAAGAAIAMAAWRVRQRPELFRPLVLGLLAGMSLWVVLQLAGFNGAPPTQNIPALRLTGLDGAPTQLAASAKGRAMVVNLWATWCPPCQREMPALARAQKLHQEIDFVFVNEGESLEVVRRYLHFAPFRLENVLVDDGNLLGKAMNSSALPLTMIYGADGKLAFSHQGLISEAVLELQLERCCRTLR